VDLFEGIAQLGTEIRILAPALLGEKPPPRATVEPTTGPLHFQEFQRDGRTILLVANASEEPVSATFHLGWEIPAETVRVMFENRRIELTGDTFRDDFAPLGTQAYEVGAPR